jgi:peptidoglycan/LPS O-acetylase OafA/YrhL
VAFYAAVPLLGWAGMHFGRGEKGRLRAFWCSIFAIAIATRGWLMANADAQTQNAAYIALHHLPGLLIEFLMGVAAWSALEGMKRRRGDGRAAWKALGWAGLAGMAGACVAWNLLESHRGHDWFHGQMGIVVAACFAVVLVSTASWAPASASAAGLAAWAGRLSYGTYLLHPLWGSAVGALEPRVGAAYALLAGMAGLFLSVWALNVLIEEPARQWGRRWAAKWDTSAGPARADQ